MGLGEGGFLVVSGRFCAALSRSRQNEPIMNAEYRYTELRQCAVNCV